MKKLFLIGTTSVTEYQYVVEAESEDVAKEILNNRLADPALVEITQKHHGENIASTKMFSCEEFQEMLITLSQRTDMVSPYWLGENLIVRS